MSIENLFYFLAKSEKIVDVSFFMLAVIMSKNRSRLVSLSDDSDENLKSSSDVDSHGWHRRYFKSVMSCQIIVH